MTTQESLARDFSNLHVAGAPLILPNAWDAGSARIVQAAGAHAVATTSAGVSWSLGYSDGQHLPLDLALASVARIVKVVDLPVSADIEGGFGELPSHVEDVVGQFISAGVVGINLEDSLRPVEEQTERIEAARAAADNAGVALFINARIDTHRLGAIGDDRWLDETIERARAYAAAGASGVFVLGALTPGVIQTLARTLQLPVNVAFGPGTLPVRELAAAGASRISAGSSLTETAYGLLSQMASGMLEDETAVPELPALSYSELNSIIG